MNELGLDKDEKELLASVESGEWRSIQDFGENARKYREYARSTFKKDRRINIRISSRDLEGLQKIAIEEGIPYQTLVSSVLHKYVSGTLIEKSTKP